MADRIGVINKGGLMLVEEKEELMKKFGKKQLTLHLQAPLTADPGGARAAGASSSRARARISSTRSTAASGIDIPTLLQRMSELSIVIKDLQTQQSSLEDIFVSLVSERRERSGTPCTAARIAANAHAPRRASSSTATASGRSTSSRSRGRCARWCRAW